MGKLQELAVSSAQTFKCLIPSKGKMANLRVFLVKEQKLLLMAKESGGDQTEAVVDAVTQLLQNCMLDDIDVKSLPSFDTEYMFVQLFMNSTANKYSTAHYQCKAGKKDADGNPILDEDGEPVPCNEINKLRIDLSKAKVPVDEIRTGIIEINSGSIEKLVLKYPSFEQMTAQELGLELDELGKVFQVYSECLTSIYKSDGTVLVLGEDYEPEDAVEFLEYLSGEAFEKVSDFFNNRPTVSASEHFTCKACGNETDISLRGLEDFF